MSAEELMLLNGGVGEDSWESLDCKQIEQSILKEISPEYSLRFAFMLNAEADAEAEAPILWPPDAENWLIGNAPDAGKDRRQEEKGMTEDEVVEWHHWFDGHEFE